VFFPKFRRKAMTGQAREDAGEIPAALCGCKRIKIAAGAVEAGHARLRPSMPPKPGVSDFMGRLKGKPAMMIPGRHPDFGSRRNRRFRVISCLVSAAGSLDVEQAGKYIQDQEEDGMSMNKGKKRAFQLAHRPRPQGAPEEAPPLRRMLCS
jgi:putative transposase